MTDTFTPPTTPAVATTTLPQSPRSRLRTSWLMLAAAMFLLTAIVVWWGLSAASDRTQALVTTVDVSAGEILTEDMIGTSSVSLDDGFGRVYTESQLDAIVGTVAAVDLTAGDLLGPSLLASEPATLDGERLVGVVLRAGRYPVEIQQGDRGLAVRTLQQTDLDGRPDTAPARVVSVSISQTDEASVSLAIPSGEAAAVASWAGRDELVLVIEPIGADAGDDAEADAADNADDDADDDAEEDDVEAQAEDDDS